YDDADQQALIKECMAELDIDRDRLPHRSALDRISRAKDACQGPGQFAEAAAGNPFLERVARIYTRYQKRLGELQAVDFGDIIRLTVKLFDDDARIREAYQRRWRFIMVDEYQDTNRSQYRLLLHLAAAHRNLCVVGDDDQSIYRWRGADIGNILRFEQDFPGAAVVRLEQNYRSTKPIIAAASAVVSQNAGRKPKEIWTSRDGGARVLLISCESERREAEAVAARIKEAACGSRKLRDFAIFYRTNAQSRPFEEIFRREGLQYRIYGGIRFYERAEVKDVLAYLRLIVDRHDDVALLRVINVPARGLGKTTVDRLKAFASERSLSFFDAIVPFVEIKAAGTAQSKRLTEFHDTIDAIDRDGMGKPLPSLLHDVLELTGLVEALARDSSIESEARLENINELVAAVEEFVPSDGSHPLIQFLDQVALVSDADSVDETQGAVTMMTLHIAKGLEFPCVFMVGLEESLLPHARSIDDPEELEEERRLCYVGMTRAMDELVLTHAFRRSVFGSERYNVASRFLDEIPHDVVDRCVMASTRRREPEGERGGRGGVVVLPLCKGESEGVDPDLTSPSPSLQRRGIVGHDVQVTSHQSQVTSHGFSDFDQRPPDEQGGALAKGRRVRHPTFGVGVIMSCERTSSGHKVTVRFQGGSEKRLIAEFAGLMPA
ncbi:MAG: 3'-5' exonuclease, partial [bacterium]